MITIIRLGYVLLLSYNPCDIFEYYNVTEMHGLNYADCQATDNDEVSAYIAGWSNIVPSTTDDRFVFINLSRCDNEANTFALVMHELMHQSFYKHNYDVDKEEEIITWAEEESIELFKIIKTKQR